MDYAEGEVLYFNKPYTWTSFKLVGRVRWILSKALKKKKLKVGHAGTLDPLATGVLIVCTGKATKQIESFQYQTKEYNATLRLGATTPSFDLEHEIDAFFPYEHITKEMIESVLPQFLGEIMQISKTDKIVFLRDVESNIIQQAAIDKIGKFYTLNPIFSDDIYTVLQTQILEKNNGI